MRLEQALAQAIEHLLVLKRARQLQVNLVHVGVGRLHCVGHCGQPLVELQERVRATRDLSDRWPVRMHMAHLSSARGACRGELVTRGPDVLRGRLRLREPARDLVLSLRAQVEEPLQRELEQAHETAAALGFAEQSGLPLELALIRNHYVGRTFIQPTQAGRDAKVKVKYNAVREVLEGKSVVMVDDSIVRGTTTRGLVAMVRAAGAREVHMRVSSAPITGPCYYGIDTPNREELIAANMTTDEIAAHIGVDSLGYLSLDGMLESVPGGPTGFCHACFSGDYPTPPPTDPDKLRFGCGC